MVEQILAKTQELVALYGLNVIAAIAILIIGRLAANIIRKIIENIMMRTKVDVTLVSFVASLSYVGLMAFVIIAALGQLGIQTTSFIAVLGAAGLAVGLALQGSLSNFAAGRRDREIYRNPHLVCRAGVDAHRRP
jgi:small conductance mechanosensitive channel